MIARINNVDIHYEVLADGPPTLVWLHGLMGSIERARAAGEGVEQLAQRGVRVVVYDARGHGASGFTPEESDYTWQSHARDMLALIDCLGIERAALGGGSMGARTALTVALDQPERVEKLVLAALPGFGGEIKTAQDVFLGLAGLIDSVGVEKAAEIVLQLPQFASLRESDPYEYDRMREFLAGIRPDAPTAIRGLLADPQLDLERLRTLRVPTLVIGHSDDPVHPLSAARQAHEAIAGSQLLEGDGPNYWRIHNNAMVDAIASFLAG